MSTQFLYPCDCGHQNQVSVNDAGKSLDCGKCGNPIGLPGMREIRKLEPVTNVAQKPDASPTWTFEKGIYFSFGMGAVVIGLTVAGICSYIAYFYYPFFFPDIRGVWNETASVEPVSGSPVWGYSPEPMPDVSTYEPVTFDKGTQTWRFDAYPEKEPVPRNYISKWGTSLSVTMESSVNRSSVDELWEFWYDAEPSEPLPEWNLPVHIINNGFAKTYYVFAAIGGVIAIVGFLLVGFAVLKRSN